MFLQFSYILVTLLSPLITFCNYLLAFYASVRLMLCVVWLKARWRYNKEKLEEKFSYEEGSLSDDEWPMVTVQLPCYNERNVIERLIRAVAKLDYPLKKLQIQVLDDSTDETSEIIQKTIQTFPKDFSIDHVRRPDRTGFKAGAMDCALKYARGEFIAIFDADFVPDSDFLKKIIYPFLKDERIGVVQAQWGSLNENENLLTKLQSIALGNHFNFEQFGRCYGGLFLNFNGTCGAWRKSTISDAGGWEHDTLCEDLDLSFRAQFKGWKILYLKDIIVPGEIPNNIQALKLQQYRWSKGGIQAFKKLFWTIIKADIPLRTKFFAASHLSGSTIYIWMFLTSVLPVLIMPFQPGYVPKWFFWLGLAGPIAALSISQISQRKYKNLIYIPLVLAMGYGMALNSLHAVFDGLRNQGGTFARTPKQGNDGKKKQATVKAYKERRYPWGELFFLSVSVGVILFGSVVNPFFYLTHLFYASCYTLMVYFFYQSYVEEQAVQQQQQVEEESISNDAAPHVEISIESTAKPAKGKGGISVSTFAHWFFLLFLVFLARTAFLRFPVMSDQTSGHIWGYMMRSDVNLAVPDKIYNSCPGERENNQEYLANSFSEWRDNNFFVMKCTTYPYSYKTASKFSWSEYYQPQIIDDEYIIARCGNKLQFHVRTQVNSTTIRRATHIRDIVEEEEHTTALNDKNRRANVLVLAIDGNSAILNAFNSFFPKTNGFIKYVNGFESFKSFSFDNYRPASFYDGGSEIALTSGCGVVTSNNDAKHSIKEDDIHFPYGSGDSDSMYEYYRSSDLTMVCPQYSSQKRNEHAGHNHGGSSSEEPISINVKEMPDLWLWNKYQKLGYVTLYGDESCNSKQGDLHRRNNNYGIGNGATQFFNKKGGLANDHVYGVHTCERYFTPKCYGSKHLHNDTFSYISSFWEGYNEVSRMALVHVESTVTKVGEKELINLDAQLADFLETFHRANSDTIIAIVGNPTSAPSSLPEATSFFKLLVPTSFLEQHSGSIDLAAKLASNQQKLITSYDIYTSMSSLLKMMYPEAAIFNSVEPGWSYSIFNDNIPSGRNCRDARLPQATCQN